MELLAASTVAAQRVGALGASGVGQPSPPPLSAPRFARPRLPANPAPMGPVQTSTPVTSFSLPAGVLPDRATLTVSGSRSGFRTAHTAEQPAPDGLLRDARIPSGGHRPGVGSGSARSRTVARRGECRLPPVRGRAAGPTVSAADAAAAPLGRSAFAAARSRRAGSRAERHAAPRWSPATITSAPYVSTASDTTPNRRSRARRVQLFLRRTPLQRQHRAPRLQQWQRPASAHPACATARAVTTGADSRSQNCSARPRCTSTLPSPSSSTAARSQVVRRSMGSTRCIRTSGRAIASASPGSRHPSRRRSRRRPLGRAGWTTAQLSTCRSQSRGTSRGPTSPWETPLSARIAANARRAPPGPRTPRRPAAGAGGGADTPSLAPSASSSDGPASLSAGSAPGDQRSRQHPSSDVTRRVVRST